MKVFYFNLVTLYMLSSRITAFLIALQSGRNKTYGKSLYNIQFNKINRSDNRMNCFWICVAKYPLLSHKLIYLSNEVIMK